MILLPVTDDGRDGVFFNARRMEDPLGEFIGITFLLFGGLILKIPRVCV